MSQKHGIPTIKSFDAKAFEEAVRQMLLACGIDENNPHTAKTHVRVRELWQERLLGGYETSVADVLGKGFEDPRTDPVIIKDIAVHGVCPHHLVPFKGVAHVAYVPGGRLHGFGGIARLVDAVAHRFTYQEWMTRDVADALVEFGFAQGAACVVEAEQLCLLLGENRRGDERVRTQAFSGVYSERAELRAEFLSALS